MTVDANRVSLLPCPLCNCGMMLDRFVDWEGQPLANQVIIHPSPSECPLVDTQIDATPEAIAAWNRRSPSLSGGEVDELIHKLRGFEQTYGTEFFTPLTEREKAQVGGELRSRIAADMGRHLAKFMVEAADALAAKDAEIAELREQLRVSDLEGEHAFALAVDDPGKNPPVTWKSRAEAAEARANAALEALKEIARDYDGENCPYPVPLVRIGQELRNRQTLARAVLSTLNGAKP